MFFFFLCTFSCIQSINYVVSHSQLKFYDNINKTKITNAEHELKYFYLKDVFIKQTII